MYVYQHTRTYFTFGEEDPQWVTATAGGPRKRTVESDLTGSSKNSTSFVQLFFFLILRLKNFTCQ